MTLTDNWQRFVGWPKGGAGWSPRVRSDRENSEIVAIWANAAKPMPSTSAPHPISERSRASSGKAVRAGRR
ncbi:MAG: hypothetical protein OEV40_20875, partial [Acidimicrobiia bacterium]|nr:hypothetical protein [Acidimicrobiia bacterium]